MRILKQVFIYFAIVFGVGALVIATSREWTWDIRIARGYYVNHAWWGQYASDWGDLVNMSYLDKVKSFREAKSYSFTHPADDGNKNIDLYIYGDSYTRDVPADALANLHSYHYQTRIEDFYYSLDSAYRNILIIEFSERFVAEELSTTQLTDVIKRFPIAAQTSGTGVPPKAANKPFSIDDLFNPHINQNLEYHLFDYNFLTWIRQMKAALNYKLFNRASGDVTISENGAYLFYKPTVSDNRAGIYNHLEKPLLDSIITSLNSLYIYYRHEGFAEVYLSIIPNPATILQPYGYNGLIPALQSDPALKMPVIDVYSGFKKSNNPAALFRAGDTHWNNNGMQIWMGIVNSILRMESKKQELKTTP